MKIKIIYYLFLLLLLFLVLICFEELGKATRKNNNEKKTK